LLLVKVSRKLGLNLDNYPLNNLWWKTVSSNGTSLAFFQIPIRDRTPRN
jgi:hypothetical protein